MQLASRYSRLQYAGSVFAQVFSTLLHSTKPVIHMVDFTMCILFEIVISTCLNHASNSSSHGALVKR